MASDQLAWLREGRELSAGEQIRCIVNLSIPAIFAQISSVVMEYIDASMVGQLGAQASAAIGLVSSTTWLIGGVTGALATGFTVQVAHRVGAGEDEGARHLVKNGLLTVLVFSLIIASFAWIIGGGLPGWLGGEESIRPQASAYFRIYSAATPVMMLSYTAGGMLQCSGNMKIPSMVNILMCVLDVLFNALLIFPTRTVSAGTWQLTIPGAGLGVRGAALGTALAELVCCIIMLYALLVRSEKLHLRREKAAGWSYRNELTRALKIALPIAAEHGISGGAQIASTRIVAPLGSVSIAANSFAVTAEALCYMPGYGIQSAATALIGQSIGAKRKDMTARLGWLSIGMGMIVMTATGILMYFLAPQMMAILSPVEEIQALGVQVLRIEAFAEPFFAASIVTAGVFRGAGKTMISTVINMSTMWLVRIPLAWYLAPKIGLKGVWIAMALQLTVSGLIFLLTMLREQRREATS